VKQFRAGLPLTLASLDDPGRHARRVDGLEQQFVRERSARIASSATTSRVIANSVPKAGDRALGGSGVIARRLRTSFSRLVATVLERFRASAVRSAETASSKFRCSM